MKTIKGITGIITNNNGDIVCTESDFDTSKPAGFSVCDIQKNRLEHALEYKFYHEFVYGGLKTTDSTLVRYFWENAKKNGFKMTFVDVEASVNGG